MQSDYNTSLMMNDSKSKAIDILQNTDARFYIDMTEALRTGRAQAAIAEEDCVLIHVPDCIWYMMTRSEESALAAARHVALNKTGTEQLVCHDDVALQQCARIVGQKVLPVPVMLFGYFSDVKFDVPDCFSLVPSGRKDMFDGYVNGVRVGFIGIREEGTIGHLEVFPEHRRKGYGTLFIKAVTNMQMENGLVPSCHILENNVPSIAIHRALGYWTDEVRRIYWMG